jgi:hypothetical protein
MSAWILPARPPSGSGTFPTTSGTRSRAQAAQAGQSLQGFLLALITGQARSGRNAVLLRRFAERDDGARTAPGGTADELAAEREPHR